TGEHAAPTLRQRQGQAASQDQKANDTTPHTHHRRVGSGGTSSTPRLAEPRAACPSPWQLASSLLAALAPAFSRHFLTPPCLPDDTLLDTIRSGCTGTRTPWCRPWLRRCAPPTGSCRRPPSASSAAWGRTPLRRSRVGSGDVSSGTATRQPPCGQTGPAVP